MELVPARPHIDLRGAGEDRVVVLAFPYDERIVAACRAIPDRRFDWDAREWWAPASDWAAVHVAAILERFPELDPSDAAAEWLSRIDRRWIGRVDAVPHAGRGWFRLRTSAGALPDRLLAVAEPLADGDVLLPLTAEVAAALREHRSARVSAAAERCLQDLETGHDPPPARLRFVQRVEEDRLQLDVLWDGDAGIAFEQVPGAMAARTLPIDPWVLEGLDAFVARHRVEIDGSARPVLDELRAQASDATAAINRSRATSGEPIEGIAERLGGTLQPFQWAGVDAVLRLRGAFLADEQGLGKTVQALAALEADDAFPAVVVCPASLKLNWEREAARWVPHRSVAVLQGRVAVPPRADIVILNYEIVAHHREALARRGMRALVIDESHHCKNPQAKRTQAVRRLAEAVPPGGLRLALTGTPVLNRPDEIVSQLRIIGRLGEYGSGTAFARRFAHDRGEARLHWHLRRACFVRRTKAEVLPQLPAKRRVVVPMALANRGEYAVAERDVIEWLRSQPIALDELPGKIAAALRAERLAQLGALQRIAGRGKLAAALRWIEDFMEHGEPLVVFARHREVQDAVVARFPDAHHLLGADSVTARDATVAAFQAGEGSGLIVCATRVASQGLTLTRASNVAFLELEWTPAMHDQAEDRCHRIGQRDAVTAWYLLAADTIDESMARLIEHKRSLVDAITDGRERGDGSLVEAVIRELRDGVPFRHLQTVGEQAAPSSVLGANGSPPGREARRRGRRTAGPRGR